MSEVKAGKFGPATENLANTLLTAVIGKNAPPAPKLPPPEASQPRVAMLPVPVGGGQQAPTSSATPNQPDVPGFSPEDPMNMSTLVVKAIYNMVG